MSNLSTSPLRAVLAGCGAVSHAWLSTALSDPQYQVVGLVDLFSASAEAHLAKYGLDVPIFPNIATALAELKPDVVFDCTPPQTHTAVACAALEAGAHVFSEKPLSDTLENARTTVETARRTGKTFAVMQNRRAETSARRVHELIAGGAIGELHAIYADFYRLAIWSGFRTEMPHVLLVDMSIHHFDIARYFTGVDAETVYCLETNPPWKWNGFGPNANAIFTMNGGKVFNYAASWCAEGLETSWNGHWRIDGEFGTLYWDGEGKITLETSQRLPDGKRVLKRVEEEVPNAAWPGAHASMISGFARSVLAGEVPETHGADNIKSLAMVFAAVASAESGTVQAVAAG